METLFIPTEDDFRKWIKEAIMECLPVMMKKNTPVTENEEPLLSRKEIAKKLRISLVTLTDWVKRGLPSHKQRGRVYFLYSEVLAYLKEHPLEKFKFKSRFVQIE
jgi:hypothetical protein